MITVKEMSDFEKFALVQDNIIFYISFVSDFIRQNLGEEAEMDLRKLWEQGEQSIPDNASDHRKYEIAYQNWIWMATSNFKFIDQRLGAHGLILYELEEAKALNKKNRTPALAVLGLIRAISPEYAFRRTSKQFAYQLQWLTPYTISEMTGDRLVVDIPQCKILEYPDTEDVCLIACQKIYPRWAAGQFMLNMAFERHNHHCTCTITPL